MKNFIKTGLAQLALLAGTLGLTDIPGQAGVTVPKCAPGEIPGSPSSYGTCLANLEGFKIRVYSAKLCQQHPMPSGSSSVNLSNCFNLFDSSTKKEVDIALSTSVNLPDTGRSETIPAGSYTHFILVMEPWIQQKGTYRASNGTIYRTAKLDKNSDDSYLEFDYGLEGKNVTDTPGNPEWVGDIFRSKCGWQAENWESTNGGPSVFVDCGPEFSEYCDPGVTQEHCNVNYNGNKITGILASADLQPLVNAQRFIYVSELETVIPISDQIPNGILEVSVIAGAEVSGNGYEVANIWGQPFIFNVKLVK